jgi:hypothetical protein
MNQVRLIYIVLLRSHVSPVAGWLFAGGYERSLEARSSPKVSVRFRPRPATAVLVVGNLSHIDAQFRLPASRPAIVELDAGRCIRARPLPCLRAAQPGTTLASRSARRCAETRKSAMQVRPHKPPKAEPVTRAVPPISPRRPQSAGKPLRAASGCQSPAWLQSEPIAHFSSAVQRSRSAAHQLSAELSMSHFNNPCPGCFR